MYIQHSIRILSIDERTNERFESSGRESKEMCAIQRTAALGRRRMKLDEYKTLYNIQFYEGPPFMVTVQERRLNRGRLAKVRLSILCNPRRMVVHRIQLQGRSCIRFSFLFLALWPYLFHLTDCLHTYRRGMSR